MMKIGKIDIENCSPEEATITFDLKTKELLGGDKVAERKFNNLVRSHTENAKCEYVEFDPNTDMTGKVMLQGYNSYDLQRATEDIKAFIDEKLVDEDTKTVMSVLAGLAAKAEKSNYGSMQFPDKIYFEKKQPETLFEVHPNMCLNAMQFQSQVVDLNEHYAPKKILELFNEYDQMTFVLSPFTRLHFNIY